MPDIIKGTKRKTPLSGGGAYIDGGSRTTVQQPAKTLPSLADSIVQPTQKDRIGRLQGVRSAGTSAGASSASAVQEEIKRRVNAAANARSSTGSTGSTGYGAVPSTVGSTVTATEEPQSSYDASPDGAMSYEEYYRRTGGDSYEDAVQKAVAARVRQAADGYRRQQEQAATDYEDAARQAYINSRIGQRNLDQQMAASGIYGGMADSQRIAMEADYQNELSELERQYLETLQDLEQAITDAQLAGDQQAAEQMASYRSTVQGQYASYLMEKEQEAADAAAMRQKYSTQQAYGGGSGGYDNGSLTPAQVAAMQNALGVTADGQWGSQSSAAAGGLTADEAWQAYQEAMQGGSQSEYSYGGAGVNRTSRM